MEEGNSTDSVIICSTNHPSLLDRALLRRYDQVLEFDTPTSTQIKQLISTNIVPMKIVRPVWRNIIHAAEGLSQSEIVRAADDAVKTAILDERKQLTTENIIDRLHASTFHTLTSLRSSRPKNTLANKASAQARFGNVPRTGQRFRMNLALLLLQRTGTNLPIRD